MLGVVLFVDLVRLLPSVSFFYSNDGIYPAHEIALAPYRWSFHLFFRESALLYFVFAVHILIVLLYLFGLRGRTAGILLFLFTVSLHNRNPAILHGGDNLLRVLLFWSLFLPVSERFSLDSLKHSGQSRTSHRSIFSTLIIAQLLFLYLISGWSKSGASWTVDYNAISLVMELERFQTPAGLILSLFPGFCRFLTFLTLWMERLFPVAIILAWSSQRCRTVIASILILFHLGLAVTMRLGIFPFICIAGCLLLFPSSFWDALESRMKKKCGEQPSEPKSPSSRPLMNLFGLALLTLLTLVNFRALNKKYGSILLPKTIIPYLNFIGLDQHWGFFAPNPLNSDTYIVARGETVSGRIVNLHPLARFDDRVIDGRPADPSALYGDHRWRKLLGNVTDRKYKDLERLFSEALCRRWNRAHPDDPVKLLEVWHWREFSSSVENERLRRVPLWRYRRPERVDLES